MRSIYGEGALGGFVDSNIRSGGFPMYIVDKFIVLNRSHGVEEVNHTTTNVCSGGFSIQ